MKLYHNFLNRRKHALKQQKKKKISRRIKRLPQNSLGDSEIFNAIELFIPTRFDSKPPSNEHTKGNFVTGKNAYLLHHFLRDIFHQDEKRFFLILGDSGAGKTTFLINLFFEYYNKGITEEYDLRIIPLGEHRSFSEVEKELRTLTPQSTILLMDALDECSLFFGTSFHQEFDQLIELVKDFRIVVFTCRTQFFANSAEEPNKLGIRKFGTDGGYSFIEKYYVYPFNDKDIRKYLNKRFGLISVIYRREKKIAKNIVRQFTDLSVRPMLLRFIGDLAEKDRKEPYKYHSEIYQVLIEKWIHREGEKWATKNILNKNNSDEYKKSLLQFSKEVALRIYFHYKNDGFIFPIDEIPIFLKDAGLFMESKDAQVRSLLIRSGENNLKFAHKSILEYFLALEYIRDKEFRELFQFVGFDYSLIFILEYYHKHFREAMLAMSDSGKHDSFFRIDPPISKIIRFGGYKRDDFIQLFKAKFNRLYFSGIDFGSINLQLSFFSSSELTAKSETVDFLRSFNFGKIQLNLKLSERKKKQPNYELSEVLKFRKEINHLEIIDLSPKDFDQLSQLYNLRYLKVHNFRFSDFPNLSSLRKLETLIIKGSNLLDIESISLIRNLKTLKVMNSSIKNLEFGSAFSGLLELDLSRNNIETICFNEDVYWKLEGLDVSGNKIKTIDGIGYLSELTRINISDNLISTFSSILKLPKLSELLANNVGSVNFDVPDPHRFNTIAISWMNRENFLSIIESGITNVKIDILELGFHSLAEWEEFKSNIAFQDKIHLSLEIGKIYFGNVEVRGERGRRPTRSMPSLDRIELPILEMRDHKIVEFESLESPITEIREQIIAEFESCFGRIVDYFEFGPFEWESGYLLHSMKNSFEIK